MAHIIWPLLFWTALLLLAYMYVGYPLTAYIRARLTPKPHHRAPGEPTVTVVVVAYNEAARIDARIENLLALDYPRSKLQIVVASDGSTDATAERARRHAGVAVHAFSRRRGKAAVLNSVVPSAPGDIVVFADARQLFDAGAIRALVANFADSSVGAVSGELMLSPAPGSAAVGEGSCFYWRYEKFIRRHESRAGSIVGATGAIYAIRRTLFEPLPDDTVLDDVWIPLRIARRGHRVLFEPAAHAYDCASATAGQEFTRKVRTIAGTFQLFARERWLFNPVRNRLWLQAFSHKGLRLLAPLLELTLLLASTVLFEFWLYRGMLMIQLACYGAACAGYAQRDLRRRLKVLTVPYTVCLLNWATVVGFARFVTGRQTAMWDRVAPPEWVNSTPLMTSAHPIRRLLRS
jgi:cellulose synthase/poly-beta-1,6-N-acetylglucosamine synthase-like glycosyltransferase